MAGTGATDLHDLSVAFLEAVVEALDTVPTYAPGLGGAPERSFIAPGTPALDCCPQVTVHVGPLSEGATVPKTDITRINHVTLIATMVRCVPVPDSKGNPPSPEDQEAAAEQINADKWVVWNHIWNLVSEGLLFDKCGKVIWGQLAPITPSGGCGGSTLSITVSLDGYQEVFGT